MKNLHEMPKGDWHPRWEAKDCRQVVENSHDGMAMHDPFGKVIYINQRLLDMLGYPASDVVGKSLSKFMKTVPGRPQPEHQNRRKGSRGSHEVTLQRKDGRTIPALVSHTPLVERSGEARGEFIVVLDITERKRIEQNRENLINNLTRVVSEKGQIDEHIPICSSCKRVRLSDSKWQEIEEYLRVNMNIEFSHGICPSCISDLYPDFDIKNS